MRARPGYGKALPAALLLAASVVATILAACGGGGYGMGSMGSTPASMGCMSDMNAMNCMAATITMLSPGATVNRTVTLTAKVTSMSGDTVMRVDFMVDGASVGTVTMEPFTLSWDTTTVSDGTHTLTAMVTDSMHQVATSAAVSVQVDNNPNFSVLMAPAQIIPLPSSAASGTVTLAAKLANGTVSGKVMVSGVTPTAVTINEAFAGNTGTALITLVASGTMGEWDVPAGAMLTSDQMTALMRGGLYVIATSTAHPSGEIRGQITPSYVMVVFSPMQGAQEVPPVNIAAAGIAATTVDSSANTLTVHVHTTGVADAMAADVDNGGRGTTGAMLTALTLDNVEPGHWSTQLATVTASDVTNFKTSKWYVNVATPTDPSGAIRGQIEVPGS